VDSDCPTDYYCRNFGAFGGCIPGCTSGVSNITNCALYGQICNTQTLRCEDTTTQTPVYTTEMDDTSTTEGLDSTMMDTMDSTMMDTMDSTMMDTMDSTMTTDEDDGTSTTEEIVGETTKEPAADVAARCGVFVGIVVVCTIFSWM